MKPSRVSFTVGLTLVLMAAASAAHADRPAIQFPWPTTDPARELNGGSTYDCDLHTGTGGSYDSPGTWDRYALDFDLNYPNDVAAVADGAVILNEEDAGIGLGNWIALDHGGYFSVYAHLRGAAVLAVGKRARAGERLGDAGESGLSDPDDDHLHFQYGQGMSPTPSSVTPIKAEPMTGKQSGAYVGQEGFKDNFGCPGFSEPWNSANPLTDALLYSIGGGTERTLKSNGAGSWGYVTGDFGDWTNYVVLGRFDGDADVDVWLWSGNEDINPNSEVISLMPPAVGPRVRGIIFPRISDPTCTLAILMGMAEQISFCTPVYRVRPGMLESGSPTGVGVGS